MPAIDRRKIVYKLILGYLLALSLVVGIVMFSLSRLDDIEASVDDITNRLSVTRSLSQSITAKIRLVRFHGEQYRRFYRQEDLDQFNVTLQDVKDGLQNISNQMRNDDWIEMVHYIQEQTLDYEQEFKTIAQLIMYQQSQLSTVFLKQELLIENQLSAIRINVGIFHTPDIFFSFGNARNAFLLMRLYQEKYIQEADEKYYILFKNNYRYASQAFQDLNSALHEASGDSLISSSAIRANEELTKYYDTFLDIRRASLEQNTSLKRLDYHELEVTNTAAAISAAIDEEYHVRNTQMEKLVLRTQVELVVAFIIAAALSFWVIFIVSRKVTAPIFQKLQREAEELTIARDKAEVANRVKSDFMANMSHELRTPLNAVIGFSELLSSMHLDARQRSFVDAIHSAGNGLLRLINDILDLSKIEAGKMTLTPSTTSLKRVFEEIEQIVAFTAQEKALALSVNHPEDLPEFVELDEIRLRQILLNLVGNAIKFTEEGMVTVETRYAGRSGNTIDLFITISDTGIGIAEEDQEKVFNSFEQQSNQDVNRYGGTGLGLSITRELVELMNGTITLTSTPGKGSRFDVTLPGIAIAEAPPDHTPAIASDRFNAVSFSQVHVLAADNKPSNRAFTEETLSELHLDVLPARYSREAIKLAQEEHSNRPVNSKDVISIDGVTDAHVLVSQLKDEVLPALDSLKKAFVVSDFTAMSESLAQIGNRHEIPYFSEFALRIEQLVDAFDIKGMNDAIQHVSEIVENVIKTVETSGEREKATHPRC